MRWTHRTRGSIPPSKFIPLAEKSGLIVELDDWVLRQASKSCQQWQQAGYKNLKVAVNVSAIQFEQYSFSDRVASILAESGIEPSLLVIELTESTLLKNLHLAKEHLSNLRSLGIEIALDDFGTGYSSLSYLQDLPADTIKLDRIFVTREYSERPAMLESIVSMAHNIGLRVVAEGVETPQQIEFLRNIACDQVQGYYYSRPIASGSVVHYLGSHAAATHSAIHYTRSQTIEKQVANERFNDSAQSPALIENDVPQPKPPKRGSLGPRLCERRNADRAFLVSHVAQEEW